MARPRARIYVRGTRDRVAALQPAVRRATARCRLLAARSVTARCVCRARRIPLAYVSADHDATLLRGVPRGSGPDIRAHDRRVRRRADGGRQSPRDHTHGLDRDLRRRAGAALRRGNSDGIRTADPVVPSPRRCLRDSAPPLGRLPARMTLTATIARRISASFVIDVDFSATAGITILFGASGSGKSTILRCIAGLMTPDRGRIT